MFTLDASTIRDINRITGITHNLDQVINLRANSLSFPVHRSWYLFGKYVKLVLLAQTLLRYQQWQCSKLDSITIHCGVFVEKCRCLWQRLSALNTKEVERSPKLKHSSNFGPIHGSFSQAAVLLPTVVDFSGMIKWRDTIFSKCIACYWLAYA